MLNDRDLAAPSDTIFVARQPIFDPNQRLFAYELLYRNSFNNAFDSSDGTSATLNVLRDAFLVLGPQLTGSRKAFINFNADLLKKKLPLTLNPKTTVVEILEDVEADKAVTDICRELKEAGYVIALDDFTLKNENARALVDLAGIVKVDFRQMSRDERRDIVKSPWAGNVEFLAEKVETPEEFREARDSGYLYFQGYFFGKPIIVSSKHIPSNKVNYVRMLSEINRPDMDFPSLEGIIRRDTYLTFTLLNYINSAYFGLRGSVSSIMQALSLLGEREVRKWASLVVFTFIGADKPSEVSVTSLMRAKFCEDLAEKTGLGGYASEAFLTGMFSMLDVLIGRPIDEILSTINVSDDIRVALTTGANRYGRLLSLVLAYERAEWDEADSWADKLGLEKRAISSGYTRSVKWVEQIFDENVASVSSGNASGSSKSFSTRTTS
jgi:EAL and modified HD-GYP domain-containing signal transduction protein